MNICQSHLSGVALAQRLELLMELTTIGTFKIGELYELDGRSFRSEPRTLAEMGPPVWYEDGLMARTLALGAASRYPLTMNDQASCRQRTCHQRCRNDRIPLH